MPSKPDIDIGLGTRLVALRKALRMSQAQLRARTDELAAQLGPPYAPFDRGYLSGIENNRHALTLYTQRYLLAQALGLNSDDLSAYLEGRVSLTDTLALRPASSSSPPPSGADRVGGKRYGDHPRWADLVDEAREDDAGLTDETFAELAEQPFFSMTFDMLTAALLRTTARRLQNHRERFPRP